MTWVLPLSGVLWVVGTRNDPSASREVGRLAFSATRELRRHRLRDQLELTRLVAQRPQVDALAAGLDVPREQLGALPGGSDADLRAKLARISPQDRTQDPGE